MRKFLATVVCAGALAACGGGDDGSTTSTDPFPATQISIDTPVTGSISSDSERDYYKFTVPAGGAAVRFQTFDQNGAACDPANFGVDPWVEIYNSAGVFIARSDDSATSLPPGWCEDFTVALSGGVHYVMIAGWQPYPFTYTLKVTIP